MSYKKIIILCIVIWVVPCSIVAQELEDTLVSSSFIEKFMNLFEWNIGTSTISTYPSMGYDPSSGLSVGMLQVISIPAKDTSKFSRPTSIVNHVTYSTNHWANAKSDVVLYSSKGYNINTFLQFLNAPDSYYGIGNDTLNTEPTRFKNTEIKLQGSLSKSVGRIFFGGLIGDFSLTSTRALDTTWYGLHVPTQKNKLLIAFGPYMAYDTRNDVNYPHKGEHITAHFLYYPQHTENAYKFFSFQVDARKYFQLKPDFIFALQFFTGMSAGDIPFYNLYQLGGKNRLRGISNKFKYIDSHIYYSQLECRKHIWGRFSGVAFVGVGNTASSYSTLSVVGSKYVYGGGIRFQTNKYDKLNLRIDYGKGIYGDSGFYITMRESF